MEVALLVSILGLQLIIVGWLLYHSSQCSAFHERVASIEAQVVSMKKEIGDHETGLRGSLHDLRNQMSPVYMDWQRSRRGDDHQ